MSPSGLAHYAIERTDSYQSQLGVRLERDNENTHWDPFLLSPFSDCSVDFGKFLGPDVLLQEVIFPYAGRFIFREHAGIH